MRSMFLPIFLAAVLGSSGCAVSSYCKGVQSYQKTQSVAPLNPVDGLKLPESSTVLKIPAAPEKSVAYGETYKDEKGDEHIRCLDTPPEMPPPLEPKVEEKPAG